MRWIVPLALSCAVGSVLATGAFGQAPRPAAPAGGEQPRAAKPAAGADAPARAPGGVQLYAVDDPDARRKMDELLQHWEEQSGTITTLDAAFRRTDTRPPWHKNEKPEEETFDGRALLESPNLACIDLKRTFPEPGKKPEFYERIICTGSYVLQYLKSTQQIHVYPLAKQQRQRALEEGPLPFLFNMKAEQAKRRYRMVLRGESPDYFVIQIIPREQIDVESFSQAVIHLNKTSFMPDKLILVADNGKDKQLYEFTKIVTNKPINGANFKPQQVKGWEVVTHKEDEQMAPRGPGRQAPPRAVRQPTAPGRGAQRR